MSREIKKLLKIVKKKLDDTKILFMLLGVAMIVLFFAGTKIKIKTDEMNTEISEVCEKSCIERAAVAEHSSYEKIKSLLHEKYIWTCQCSNGLHMLFDSDITEGKYWYDEDKYIAALNNGKYSKDVKKFIDGQQNKKMNEAAANRPNKLDGKSNESDR